MAHELAHAELYTRVGFRRLEWCIPTWFDEGLAVQFDSRPFHGKHEFERQLEAGWHVPSFEQLRSRAGFFSGTRDQVRFHYAAARYAIAEWLRKKGRAPALKFLETMPCSNEWYEELSKISDSLE